MPEQTATIEKEEHDHAAYAKRVTLISGPTLFAVVNVSDGGGVTTVFQGGSPWNSLVTVLGGAISMSNFVSPNVGNVTLNPSSNSIGLATVVPNYFGNTAVSSLASIANTTTQILPANSNRFSLLLRNISNTTVFIGFVSPVTTSAMYLMQNDALTLDRSRGAVFGIVGAGSGEIRYLEEST